MLRTRTLFTAEFRHRELRRQFRSYLAMSAVMVAVAGAYYVTFHFLVPRPAAPGLPAELAGWVKSCNDVSRLQEALLLALRYERETMSDKIKMLYEFVDIMAVTALYMAMMCLINISDLRHLNRHWPHEPERAAAPADEAIETGTGGGISCGS